MRRKKDMSLSRSITASAASSLSETSEATAALGGGMGESRFTCQSCKALKEGHKLVTNLISKLLPEIYVQCRPARFGPETWSPRTSIGGGQMRQLVGPASKAAVWGLTRRQKLDDAGDRRLGGQIIPQHREAVDDPVHDPRPPHVQRYKPCAQIRVTKEL